MKYPKTLIPIAIVAVALMALVGATNASATVLCQNSLNTSSCSSKYAAGTEFKASLAAGTKFEAETEFKKIECGKSTIAGKIENAGSASTTVSGKVSTLTFEECNCTVVVLKRGVLEFHLISGTDNATMTTTGEEVTVLCDSIFGSVHCIYISNDDHWGQLIGGNAAVLTHLEAEPKLPTDGFCSFQAVRRGKYEVTSPKPLFAAAA